MCGIAGVIDLAGSRSIEHDIVARMAATIVHRGPDEEGFLEEPGLALASRRLSIVGLADGQQPIHNEDHSVAVVFNGELFDYVEKRAALEERGHHFRTSCDTEVLVHLWEDHGERMFKQLRGQFAFALVDFSQRQVILARDAVGICPLHWAQRGDWFYFGSEIKAILASGRVRAESDPRGIDNLFTFFALPGRQTMFQGIRSLYPGTYLKIQLRPSGQAAEITETTWWDLDFPDRGSEREPADPQVLIDEFREHLFRAVKLRLRADVPVVSYLSGGIDSGAVLAAAAQIRGNPIPSFTIRIPTPGFDEADRALLAARTVGAHPTVITCDANALASTYPQLVQAADAPVIDTACAALYRLAEEVHQQGYKVALTGEGADEALAGYPWFKTNRLLRLFDLPCFKPSRVFRWLIRDLVAPEAPAGDVRRIDRLVGGPQAQADLYSLVRAARWWFYRPEMLEQLEGYLPFEELDLNLDRMRRWHPLNQSLYLGYKTILPGLLLSPKGDRVAMAHSVETRYPFLDEDLIAFCAQVPPHWKLRGLFKDKYLFRRAAATFLPAEIANRPKAMFRAPFGETLLRTPPPFVGQLLSRESLQRTPYFDPERVRSFLAGRGGLDWLPGRRLFIEMGLTGVVATQLWHHLYLGGGLCDLPTWSPRVAHPLPSPQPV